MAGDPHPGQTDPPRANPAGPIPRPRPPLTHTPRRVAPTIDTPAHLDLDRLFTHLATVLVWTSRHGYWQEHACFVLSTTDGGCHTVNFADPHACPLLDRLIALPGFHSDRLLELLGTHTQQLVVLWQSPKR